MSETTPTRIAIMEANTETILAEQARLDAIEARAVSPEVQSYNDMAQMEIYGSGSRTYTDPSTGEVIASPADPVRGKLEDIVRDPKYGKTQAERDEYAKDYNNEVERLLSDGLELCQVKMIVDLGEADQEKYATLTGKFIADGMTPDEASRKATSIYNKKYELRIKLIKEGGAFTSADYDAVSDGRDLYNPSRGGEDDVDDPVVGEDDVDPAVERIAELQRLKHEALEGAEGNLDGARTRLAEIRARRESRTFHLRGGEKKADLEAALGEYEANRRIAVIAGIEALYADAGIELDTTGFTTEQLQQMAEDPGVQTAINFGAVMEAHALTREQHSIETAGADGKRFKRFYDFWARNSQDGFFSLGTIKKAAALAPIGIGAAIIAAPIAAVGGAVAAGGFVGTRIGRNVVNARINKNARAQTVADTKLDGRLNQFDEQYQRAVTNGDVIDASQYANEDGTYSTDTSEVVKLNRKRAARAAAIAGTIALASPIIADKVGDIIGDRVNGHTLHKDVGELGVKPPEVPNVFDTMTSEELIRFRQMVTRGEQIRIDRGYYAPGLSDSAREQLLAGRGGINDQLNLEMAAAEAAANAS